MSTVKPTPEPESRPYSRPCDIFLHLPKTGGQTFINLINRQYRERIIDTECGFLTPSNWQRFRDRLADETRRGRGVFGAVTGHMKYGLHELLPYPSHYITLLREPTARFASFYYMLQRMKIVTSPSPFDLLQPQFDSEDHASFRGELDNGQTRVLADAPMDLPFGECGESHLKAAIANLEKQFVFIGLTEQFDLSLMMLRRICGWRWRFYVPRNQSPQRRPEECLSRQIMGQIADLNQYDRRLYAFAQERFRASAAGLGLHVEHAAYRTGCLVHRGIHHASKIVKKRLRATGKKSGKSTAPVADTAA